MKERLDTLKNTFNNFKDPDDKWKYLIKIAKEYPNLDEAKHLEQYRIDGCAVNLYLIPAFDGKVMHFEMDTDGGNTNPLISRGLGVLAVNLYDGLTPAEILSIDKEFFKEIGLTNGLSPTRSNGFASLLNQLYNYAGAFKLISQLDPA